MHAHTQRVNTWSVVFIVFFFIMWESLCILDDQAPGYLHWHDILCMRGAYVDVAPIIII